MLDVPLSPSPSTPTTRSQKWRILDGPAQNDGEIFYGPVKQGEVAEHLRLSEDQAEAEAGSIELMIAAATEYAESRLNTSLMPRVIEATFYDGEPLILPRGPLIDVNSVADAGGNVVAFKIEHVGHAARIIPASAVAYPVTVTYRAGYLDVDHIPASIRLAILCHVGTLWESRESTSDKPRTSVPHQLEAFYALKSRSLGVG